jgi:hypothetical protein
MTLHCCIDNAKVTSLLKIVYIIYIIFHYDVMHRDGQRLVDFICRHRHVDNTSSMSSMSIKRRHSVNNIDNVGNCNNVRLCMN